MLLTRSALRLLSVSLLTASAAVASGTSDVGTFSVTLDADVFEFILDEFGVAEDGGQGGTQLMRHRHQEL